MRNEIQKYLFRPDLIDEAMKRIRELTFFFKKHTEIKVAMADGSAKVTIQEIEQEPDFWMPFVKTKDFSQSEEGWGDGFQYAWANNKYQVFTKILFYEH